MCDVTVAAITVVTVYKVSTFQIDGDLCHVLGP